MSGTSVASVRRARQPRPMVGRRLAAMGFLGGLAAGLLLTSQQLHRHRRNLFSPRAYERLAALGSLRGQPTIETLRLLRDYVRWEPRPLLRRRGARLLRQLERHLGTID
jgi:predicted component of type VI protein secretion system